GRGWMPVPPSRVLYQPGGGITSCNGTVCRAAALAVHQSPGSQSTSRPGLAAREPLWIDRVAPLTPVIIGSWLSSGLLNERHGLIQPGKSGKGWRLRTAGIGGYRSPCSENEKQVPSPTMK